MALVLCVSSVPVQAAQKADVNTALARANASAASTLSAIHADTNLADEMKIRQIITLLFDIKRDIFANEGLYDFDFSLFGEVNETKGADLLYFARSAAAERKLVLAFGNYPGDCETDLNFKSIQIDGNTATVNVYEWLSFYYYFPDTGKADFDSGKGLDYIIELNKGSYGWRIVGIDFENPATGELRDAGINVDAFILNQQQKAFTYTESESMVTFGISPAALRSKNSDYVVYIDRNKVLSYARTYGGTARNPQFMDCTTMEGDCMNFASQCLWYGLDGDYGMLSSAGIPMINPTLAGSTGRAWYIYPSGAHSPSWTSTNSFYNYINYGSSGTLGLFGSFLINGVQYANTADIIQVAGTDEVFNHTYIVTGVTGTAGNRETSNIYVTSHTCDLLNVLLSERGASNFRTIRVDGVVTQ